MTVLEPSSLADVGRLMMEIGRAARAAQRELAIASSEAKNAALMVGARWLNDDMKLVLDANAKGAEAARAAGAPAAYSDRLSLDRKRITAIVQSLEAIADLPDPIGAVTAEWQRPNGLKISRVRTPLGVIGIIYESRPNVTADGGGLCLKAGNAAIWRTGSDAFRSAMAIHACLVKGLREAELPDAAIQLVPTTDRAAVGAMLSGLEGSIDVIVPRGGKSLVERVQREARVPVFAHLEGICHTYVDRGADMDIALPLVVNAKLRRTGV